LPTTPKIKTNKTAPQKNNTMFQQNKKENRKKKKHTLLSFSLMPYFTPHSST